LKKQIRDLEQRLRQWLIEPLQTPTAGENAEPLDQWTGIKKQLRAHIALSLAREPIFPSRHITIVMPVRDESERSRFEGAFEEKMLRSAILAYLEEEGAKPPADLWITVEVPVVEAGTPPLSIRFDNARNAMAPALSGKPAEARPRLRVLAGESPVTELPLGRHRVNLGRGERIRDEHHNVTRRNDLPFAEVKNGVNEKVSRRHARLEYDEAQQGYRLFRDQPGADLSVRRGGRIIDDIPLGGHGVLLQPGDVIRLHRAEVEYLEDGEAETWD